MLDDEIAQELGQTGLCVCADFLNPVDLNLLCGDFEAGRERGDFASAGTGQGKGHGLRHSVRQDHVAWLDPSVQSPAQLVLGARLESLRLSFNRKLFLGLSHLEGHYAAYPVSGFYKRHLDCFHKNDDRVVSVIVYLNETWNSANGGELRIYFQDPVTNQETFSNIEPRGGTLVCFLSRDFEHEVLPSLAPRASFAGWFKVHGGFGSGRNSSR